jgi:hypothetical protein
LDTITTEDRDGIRLVTLDRPEALNAFSLTLMDELAEAFLDAAQDDAVRVLVLTGAGRAFSAGADLAENRDYEPRHGLAGMLSRGILLLLSCMKFRSPFCMKLMGKTIEAFFEPGLLARNSPVDCQGNDDDRCAYIQYARAHAIHVVLTCYGYAK